MFKLALYVTLSFSACIALAKTSMTPVSDMTATVSSAKSSALTGKIEFKQVKEGLQVTADVSGLTPNTAHGFHVHEKGECQGPDYKSAGDHFNPEHQTHGKPHSTMSHVGDLGNLQADAEGKAHLVTVVPHTNVESLKKLPGKAVIIHAKSDDLKSQPAGDSGDRIACGIIQAI